MFLTQREPHNVLAIENVHKVKNINLALEVALWPSIVQLTNQSANLHYDPSVITGQTI